MYVLVTTGSLCQMFVLVCSRLYGYRKCPPHPTTGSLCQMWRREFCLCQPVTMVTQIYSLSVFTPTRRLCIIMVSVCCFLLSIIRGLHGLFDLLMSSMSHCCNCEIKKVIYSLKLKQSVLTSLDQKWINTKKNTDHDF